MTPEGRESIENKGLQPIGMFYADNTRMLYGDGAEAVGALISELKALGGGH